MRQVNIKVIDTEEFNSGINKKIVNNLNTKEEGYLLDASQGKVLDEKKVDKNNISNSLSVEEEGYVLDARQGKILEDKIQKVIGDIDVINGTGEGSISKYVNDAITKLIAEAPESFDTLKEISNWISTHSDSASAMNTSISQLQSDLASHTHLYAGSSSAGGAATSANKLNTNAGSALNPVYFSDGIPKACTYSLNKTVPSDAVFTDTTALGSMTGTLSVEHGGTGKTTLVDSANALINSLTTASSDPEDDDYFVSQYSGGEQSTYHRRPVSALWNYIKDKISSVLGLTASSYSGNSATATKATQDASGNVITDTYALNSNVNANLNNTLKSDGYKRPSTNQILNWFRMHYGYEESDTIYMLVTATAGDNEEYRNVTLFAYKYNEYPTKVRTIKNIGMSITTYNAIGTVAYSVQTNIKISAIVLQRDLFHSLYDLADTYAKKSIYEDTTVSMGRKSGTTVGTNSFAFGDGVTASGDYSHAEGYFTIANGEGYNHAEGRETIANGEGSHAEGRETQASGYYSHAEGYFSIASGDASHVEGFETVASGYCSHAEGETSHASGECSHAEGGTRASGDYSHAEGGAIDASGYCSHAEGCVTTASGDYSHAEGYDTTALTNQHAQGHYNDTTLAKANSERGTSDGTAFVIGNGTGSTTSNAFRVTGKGATYAKAAYNSTGADYAEFAEWADGNPNNEDRRGYFVTFDEEKPTMIRKANAGEYILGIVSGNPCIIGNADEGWLGKYVFDEYGSIVYEDVEIEESYTDETGEEKTKTVKVNTYKINPEYDPTREYVHREKRKEWDAIGWIGVLSVNDDNTCKAGGYCEVTDGGIATACEKGEGAYRVIKRVTDNIIKVVLK